MTTDDIFNQIKKNYICGNCKNCKNISFTPLYEDGNINGYSNVEVSCYCRTGNNLYSVPAFKDNCSYINDNNDYDLFELISFYPGLLSLDAQDDCSNLESFYFNKLSQYDFNQIKFLTKEFIYKYSYLRYTDIDCKSNLIDNKKIAVYTICKNEEDFVDRWFDSVKEADKIYILDTGSSDSTFYKLKSLPEDKVVVSQKIYNIFRFDVAFNDSKHLIDKDYNVKLVLHMDQFFKNKNWVESLRNENIYSNRVFSLNLIENKSVFKLCSISTDVDGSFYWSNLVHECQQASNFQSQVNQQFNDLSQKCIEDLSIIHTPKEINPDKYLRKEEERYIETPYNLEAFLTYIHSLLRIKNFSKVEEVLSNDSLKLSLYSEYWDFIRFLNKICVESLKDEEIIKPYFYDVFPQLFIKKYKEKQYLVKGLDAYYLLTDNFKLLYKELLPTECEKIESLPEEFSKEYFDYFVKVIR